MMYAVTVTDSAPADLPAQVPANGEDQGVPEAHSNNARLRGLVSESGLPPAVAMTVFNRGLGAKGCTETEWKGFLAEQGSERFRPLSESQLAHAIAQFARIGSAGSFASEGPASAP